MPFKKPRLLPVPEEAPSASPSQLASYVHGDYGVSTRRDLLDVEPPYEPAEVDRQPCPECVVCRCSMVLLRYTAAAALIVAIAYVQSIVTNEVSVVKSYRCACHALMRIPSSCCGLCRRRCLCECCTQT
eukprot:4957396-Amphidinium_carterae.1